MFRALSPILVFGSVANGGLHPDPGAHVVVSSEFGLHHISQRPLSSFISEQGSVADVLRFPRPEGPSETHFPCCNGARALEIL